MTKELLGIITLLLTFGAGVHYFLAMWRGSIKPHAFSWCIWGLLTCIAACIQFSEGAGPGAWSTAGTSVLCFAIAGAAIFKGEQNITWDDWAVFIAALFSIPLWLLTDDPLLSILWITTIDMLGYYPTFRKSYLRPYEEQIFMHALGTIKQVISLFALQQFVWTTALYPSAIAIANGVLIALILWRRKVHSVVA